MVAGLMAHLTPQMMLLLAKHYRELAILGTDARLQVGLKELATEFEREALLAIASPAERPTTALVEEAAG